MIVNDITITSLETIGVYDLVTGDHRFTLDELQTAQIANTQEKTDITGKAGRKLNSLKRNKAVVVTGTNGLVSAGMLETQTGGKFEERENAPVKWSDMLTISGNTAVTRYKAVGTVGNEISKVFVKDSANKVTATLTQSDTAGENTFTYDPATKTLTFAEGAYKDGTEIHVHYTRFIKANVLENLSDVYSEKCQMYIDAYGEDMCGLTYHVQFYIPRADFSGNFDIALGDNQTVHAFEAESLAGSCGTDGMLWSYTVFGTDAEDAA